MISRQNALKLLALYNVGVAGFVTHDYFNNPNADKTEYLPDIFLHLFQAFQLTGYLDSWQEKAKDIAVVGNIARLGQIGYRFFAGSTIPLVANVADIVNHGLNIVGMEAKEEKETPALTMKP